MNTKQKLESMLIKRGMFDSQVESIMKIAIPELNELVGRYDITWDRPSDEYPDVIYNILFIAIKPIALKWINENKPKAWFKPMFQ